ncbi:c-type cytochrome [Microvirga roseola]|uniref:c-type cytochrome n=1 Tax=Microvirga roseola TaxID=2883126 RepID=UPI001E53B1B1|nr:c-type cytochrome [Microvirga roseola]
MRTGTLIFAACLGASTLSLPVLSQDFGLEPRRGNELSPGADPNRGRFLAFGGIHGELRVSCAQCHELNGVGNTSGAFPRLSDQVGWYLYKTLQDYAVGLRPNSIMGPIAKMLTPQQMQDLAAYYASIKEAPYPPPPPVDLRTRQIGGAIAAVGIPEQGVPACNGCHGPNGIGQAPLYPYLAGQYANYLELQLLLWKQGRRDGDPMNVMELISKAMTDEQIRAVSLYYASVRPLEVTPTEADIPSATVPNVEIPQTFTGNPTSVGADPTPRPNPGSTVLPGLDDAASTNLRPPYLPQQTREGPNLTTTGPRPDPNR